MAEAWRAVLIKADAVRLSVGFGCHDSLVSVGAAGVFKGLI